MNEIYVIHVTRECNCACRYCYEKDKTSTFQWGDIRALIDNIVNHSPSRFNIEFLGGEPMLAFDLIKKSVEYFEFIKNKQVAQYTITSNGTIVTEELIELMHKYPSIVWSASMDGTQFMNCLRLFKNDGKNTHDLVIKNHQRLVGEVGIGRVSLHMVTHPFNIAYLSQGIDHLYNNGVRLIGVGTVESTIQIGKEYCDKYVSELKIVSDRIKAGAYPGLEISVLSYLKPRSDKRIYIKDTSGKVIAETYGRAEKDITETDAYNTVRTSSRIGNLIEDIREIVYNYHQGVGV